MQTTVSKPFTHARRAGRWIPFTSLLLGGFAGLGVAFMSEYFSHSFNNPDDVMKHLGVPALAFIPDMKK